MNLDRLAGNVTINSLKEYLRGDFGEDVGRLLFSEHRLEDDKTRGSNKEGTLRAAAFALLRLKLPEAWLVEAETAYPKNSARSPEKKNKRPDIIVWSPSQTPFAFEVKPSPVGSKTDDDVVKLREQMRLKSSALNNGAIICGVRNEKEEEALEDLRWWADSRRNLMVISVPLRDFFKDHYL